MSFETINSIEVNSKSSWQDKLFLTFDMDWCSDQVLSYSLDILEEYNIKATFFVTHETDLLERMRKNSNIELGIHPNFNFLLEGDFRYGKSIDEVVSYYKNIVPESVSVRSHSMTQNSLILDSFEKHSLYFDCNTFIPVSSGITLKPYKHWTKKLIKVPYCWEDDVQCMYGFDWKIDRYTEYEGIKVFDFHPIHIFLNTENLNRYERSKNFHHSQSLDAYVNTTYGTYNFLLELIEKI